MQKSEIAFPIRFKLVLFAVVLCLCGRDAVAVMGKSELPAQHPLSQVQREETAIRVNAAGFQVPTWEARGVAVQDGYAYVGFRSELGVLDVSDKENVVQVASLPFSGQIYDIDMVDGVLYVSYANGFEGGLSSVDISNPLAPQKISDTEGVRGFGYIDVSGHFIYGLLGGILHIVDASDPTSPHLVGQFDTLVSSPDLLIAVVSDGEYAFVSASLVPETWMIDVSDPTAPFEANPLEFGGGAITLGDGLFYYAASSCSAGGCHSSLHVLEYSDIGVTGGGSHVQSTPSYYIKLIYNDHYVYRTHFDGIDVFDVSYGIRFVETLYSRESVEQSVIDGLYIYYVAGADLQIAPIPARYAVYLPLMFEK